jgi:hypothetical protein
MSGIQITAQSGGRVRMVGVDYVFLAHRADVIDHKIVAEGIGADVFWTSSVPVRIPMMHIVCAVQVGWNDIGIPYIGEIRFIDADGRVVGQRRGRRFLWKDTPHYTPGIPEGEPYVVARATSIEDVLFPTYGTYELEVLINDVRRKAVRFYIDSMEHMPGHGEPHRSKGKRPAPVDAPRREPALEERQPTS